MLIQEKQNSERQNSEKQNSEKYNNPNTIKEELMETGVVTIGTSQWAVSIAQTYEQLTTGLGGVESLQEDNGMLFDLGAEWPQVEINMSQMLIPLDVIFISSDLKVCGIKSNIQPEEEYLFDDSARFFLEVNAGEADSISIDDDVSIEGLESPDAGNGTEDGTGDGTGEQGLATDILETVMSLGVNILVITVVVSSMFKMFGKITSR